MCPKEKKQTEINGRFHVEEANVLKVKIAVMLNPEKIFTFIIFCMLRAQIRCTFHAGVATL